VLTTYRRDSSAVASPVWFRFHQDAFEVVVAEDDVQLRHLTARPSCGLVVFEARAPVPGLRVEGELVLVRGDVTDVRAAIAGRYLGADAGRRFAEQRRAPGVLVRLPPTRQHAWDLTLILPRDGHRDGARAGGHTG
jgi:Pyridoxamine 5'-phosphate oxidase